jgi:PPM family protein phosphatase
VIRQLHHRHRAIGAETRKGPRAENQDRVFAWFMPKDGSRFIVAVADGMGGLVGGAAAAEAAISTVRDAVGGRASEDTTEVWLSRVISEANTRVLEAAGAARTPGAGTTLTIAVIAADRIVIGHVGDSRVYLFSGDGIRCLTRDHTVGQEAIESGQVPRDRVDQYPYHYALTRSLGAGPSIEAEIVNVPLDSQSGPAPTIIVCTDGVWSALDDAAWQSMLTEGGTAGEIASRIVDAAEQRGSDDNMSAVVVRRHELRAYRPAARLVWWAASGVLIAAAATITYLFGGAWFSTSSPAMDGRTIWVRNAFPGKVAVRSGPNRLAELEPGALQPLHVLSGDSLVFEDVNAQGRPVYGIRMVRNTPDTIVIPPIGNER